MNIGMKIFKPLFIGMILTISIFLIGGAIDYTGIFHKPTTDPNPVMATSLLFGGMVFGGSVVYVIRDVKPKPIKEWTI